MNIHRTLGVLALGLAAGAHPPHAHAQSTQQICLGDSVPTGWIVSNRVYDMSRCNTPYPPNTNQGNVVTITRYDNLPVGAVIEACYDSPIPAGWTTSYTQVNSTRCLSPYGGTLPSTENVRGLNHTSCVNQSNSTCYPQQPATISASPGTVYIPYAQANGSTSVSYSAPGSGGACIWVRNNNLSPSLWHCGGESGTNITWQYVPAGGSTTFMLTTSNTAPTPLLAQTAVSGVARSAPSFSVSPASVTVPAGQSTANTTVSWNTSSSGYSSSCIWVHGSDSGTTTLWSCNGTSGSALWPYVTRGVTHTFILAPGSSSSTPQLATATVTGH